MSTIFTKIVQGDIPSWKVAEDDDFYAFLDINPLKKGHTLVIPKKEVDYIYDLDDETYTGLNLFAKKVAKAIESVIDCKRIGSVVLGLEVPHAHIHLVPLEKEEDVNFFKDKLTFTPEEFKGIAADISQAFKALPF